MMAARVETISAEESLVEYKQREGMNRLGLWLFIGSEVFLFAAIGISRAILWRSTRPELEQIPALVLTLALLLSSFFMNRAETAVAYGDRRNFLMGILITIALGTIFFLGVIFVEWPLSGLSPSESVYGAVFYFMTGMHALHVLTGVIFLAIIYRNGRKGLFTPQRHFPVEAAAVYWHFVDLVWFFFYTSIYIIGRPI
jgi:cytochrome c oxidase subunit 3